MRESREKDASLGRLNEGPRTIHAEVIRSFVWKPMPGIRENWKNKRSVAEPLPTGREVALRSALVATGRELHSDWTEPKPARLAQPNIEQDVNFWATKLAAALEQKQRLRWVLQPLAVRRKGEQCAQNKHFGDFQRVRNYGDEHGRAGLQIAVHAEAALDPRQKGPRFRAALNSAEGAAHPPEPFYLGQGLQTEALWGKIYADQNWSLARTERERPSVHPQPN